MAEQIVERVARAIAEAELGSIDQSAVELFRGRFEKHARAAIEATDRAELLVLLRRCREAGCINPFNENAELAEDIDAVLALQFLP